MSRLKKTGGDGAALAKFMQSINTQMSERGSQFVPQDVSNQLLSLESLDETRLKSLRQAGTQLEADLKDLYGAAISQESAGKLTEAQLEAGTLVALAFGNVAGYHEKAQTVARVASMEGVTVIPAGQGGAGGELDFRLKASQESFDERELKLALPMSIAFNIQAARQGEFAEAFYPTVVVSPDQLGLDVTIRRTMVMNEVRHSLTGVATDFNRKNLVDAVVDPTILASQSTLVVPFRSTSNPDNTGYFASGITFNRTVDGTTVASGPLAVNKKIGLLGLSQTAALQATGTLDNTDSLDTRMYLEALYISVTGQNGNAAGTGVQTSLIKLDTSRLPRNHFLKTVEGADRETQLTFITVDLPLTGATKDVTGAVAGLEAGGALKYLGGTAGIAAGRDKWVVRLAVTVNGLANHELGNVEVIPGAVSIDSVWDHADPANPVQVTGTPLTNLLNELQTTTPITVVGYDVYATRSNLNRRTRGLMLTTLDITERFVIPLTAPISVPAPISSNRDASDLTGLINAARIRNDNNAVTTLINYADQLEALKISTDRSLPVPAVEGIGRLMVRPFFERVPFDLLTQVNGTKSHERAADVSAALINQIRDLAYRMYRDSGYQPALDALTGGTGEVPTLVIGTDPVTLRHLMVPGDTRTASIGFNHKIVASMDERVKGKIFVTFARANAQGADPLSFGCMAWMPELAATVQINRNGSLTKESMVQPRVRHINNLPVLGVIEVTNLSDAITDKLSIWTDELTAGVPA